MSDGGLDGMQTFDKVLEGYIREGLVTREVGLAYASNATNLALAINDLDQAVGAEPAQMPKDPPPSSPAAEIPFEGFER